MTQLLPKKNKIKKVLARCPKCEKEYLCKILRDSIEYEWTGNCMPRIFCEKCKWKTFGKKKEF